LAAALFLVAVPPWSEVCEAAAATSAVPAESTTVTSPTAILPAAELQRALGKLSSGATCTIEIRGAPPRTGRYLGFVGGTDTTLYVVQYERWRNGAPPGAAPELGSTLQLTPRTGAATTGTFLGFARGQIVLDREGSGIWSVVHTARLAGIECSDGRAWPVDSVLGAWGAAPSVSAVVLESLPDTVLVPFAAVTAVKDRNGNALAGLAAAAGISVGVWLGILAMVAVAAAVVALMKQGAESAGAVGSTLTPH
jgi:uncharacterized membrane protein